MNKIATAAVAATVAAFAAPPDFFPQRLLNGDNVVGATLEELP